MKKFRCTVTRTDEYEIELDENVMNEEWMEDFRENLYNFKSLKDHAEHIAQHKARFDDAFIEGYGEPLINGKKNWRTKEGEEEAHINVNVISEDSECEVDVIEE
ncbi:hypothetical protein [Bacillus sp. Marseille-P3800]|uniref:hypothetical protein n=1 Tax=Bacillus sp. Marseille-P3800 TaxID=2014782 RepID=UPI000C0774FC|nr:hypothetical protein [Bacillus sp. Marseille-P3800]